MLDVLEINARRQTEMIWTNGEDRLRLFWQRMLKLELPVED